MSGQLQIRFLTNQASLTTLALIFLSFKSFKSGRELCAQAKQDVQIHILKQSPNQYLVMDEKWTIEILNSNARIT